MEGHGFLSRVTASETVTEGGGFPGEPFTLSTLPPKKGRQSEEGRGAKKRVQLEK